MKNKQLFLFLSLIFCLSGVVFGEVSFGGSAGPPSAKLALWYLKPATNWMTSALPIGNGRLGGMVFGGVSQEHIQFNDKTLWTGNTTTRGAYQSFGDLYFDFSGLTSVSNYRRELSLEEAISRVTYTIGSATYHREYFCSYPDNVMVMRFSSNGSANLNFAVRLADAHSGGARSVSGNRITISGKLTLLSYEAQVLVQNEGGTLTAGSDRITIANANAVTVLLAAGTDYNPAAATYVTGSGAAGVHTTVSNQINTASVNSYDTLKTNHLNDYQPLFNRVALNLNDSKPTVPTNELQKSYNSGAYNPFLDVLYYQYGRYLLISSSRGLALPSNLQGLWNDNNAPAWECDIHTDINIQMNYWPPEVINLSECHLPFLDYIYNEAINHAAWKNLASSTGNSGWTLMVQNNIFGYGDWKYTRPANAWYCMHLWQHYTYTQDTNFLSSKAYPVMKSACDFWLSRLKTASDGSLVAPGEWSPEQGPDEDGVTYAQQLIWDLFTNTINASAILNVDSSYRSNLQSKLNQLDKGLHVGSWGQLREWKYTNDDQANTHRHISHLIGLYPGKQISPLLNTTYSNAAKVSLNARGDVGPGWSRAWKIACWARLFDGNHAHTLVKNALQNATVTVIDMNNGGGAYENLLDAHPPFQIDGNFGATAGMTEMLLQSQLDKLVLLPALPDVWPKGSVSGICAQGGFDLNISWDQKKVTEAMIISKYGKTCVVKNGIFNGTFSLVNATDNSAVPYTQSGDTITFNTGAGSSYRITANSATPTPSATPLPSPTATPTPIPGTISIAAGSSSAVGSFQADQYYSGGSAYANSNTIDVSQITSNPPPAALFNNERYGAMNYTIPGFTAGNSYTVTLYFAETYLTSSGSRIFNVSLSGATVLSNFDIYAAAGGQNKAIARSFTATANFSGQIVIGFTSGTENPKINGISIKPGGSTPTPTPTPTPTGIVNTPTPTPTSNPTPTPTRGAVTATPTATPLPTGTYLKFRNVATGLYIDGMGSTSNGANCCQYSSSPSNNQQWTLEVVGSYYKIKNQATGLYLDGMGRTSNGSICGQWSSSSSTNQQWIQEAVGSYYKYKNAATGLYLDGMGSTANGSNLCQWSNSSSTNQQWQKQ